MLADINIEEIGKIDQSKK